MEEESIEKLGWRKRNNAIKGKKRRRRSKKRRKINERRIRIEKTKKNKMNNDIEIRWNGRRKRRGNI